MHIMDEESDTIIWILQTIEGLFISSLTTNSIENLEKEINNYIDTIFNLIEVKKWED